MNKALDTVGLCRRAGKIVTGFDAVADEIKKTPSKVSGVLTASDLSEKTKKEVDFICTKYGVPTTPLGATLDEIKKVLGKRTGIIAVLDSGFYGSITKSIRQGDTE